MITGQMHYFHVLKSERGESKKSTCNVLLLKPAL